MNGKKCKDLRKQADSIVLEWVKSLLSEEDCDKVNINNLYKHLPDEDYYHANSSRRLNIMSPRWVYKKLKGGKAIALS